MHVVVTALLLAFVFAFAASAQTASGREDAAFGAALDICLSADDDCAALQSLAALSATDNQAAQILLGRSHRHWRAVSLCQSK